MKKLALILALLSVVSACFSSFSFPSHLPESPNTPNFILPGSLVSIEDEAFEKTGVGTVVCPDSLVAIGERAFADSCALKTVIIPRSVIYIGIHAFDGIPSLVIQGTLDSYANQWALEHGFAFTQTGSAAVWIEMFGKLLRGTSFLSLLFFYLTPIDLLQQLRKTELYVRSMRPQDRPELYPINYRFP